MKVWIFRETGEVRIPHPGDWYLWQGRPTYFEGRDGSVANEYPIISLEVLNHDPMESIRKIWEKWKRSKEYIEQKYLKTQPAFVEELWQAIKKSVEGK